MSAGLAARPASARVDLRRTAVPVLLAGSVLLLLLFRTEAAAAVRVWRVSTAFGHCFLVLPVAAWLAWERRGTLAGRAPDPWPMAALAAVPLGLLWFATERLGLMEGRQLVAVALLLLFVLCVLGWRLWRALAVPLLYLFFLVPFGGSLVQPLQTFTARFIDVGLDLLGIPHVVTQFVIEIPEGTFRVAEACAGLRFLIASIAFGVVYACVFYRSSWRRIAFILASVVVPIIANGVRALGIVVLGHLLGSAQAGAVDHIVYGWLFFSIVIGLLILAGLPFREDRDRRAAPAPPAAESSGRATASRILGAAAALLLLAAAAPAASAALERRAAAEQRAVPGSAVAGWLAALRVLPGCHAVAQGSLDCAGTPIEVTVKVFATRSSPATLIAARRALIDVDGSEDASVSTWTLQQGSPRQWQVVRTGQPGRLVATCLWVAGTANPSGIAVRIHQAVSSIRGSARPPVLVAFSMPLAGGAGDAGIQTDLLRKLLEEQDFALSSGRRQ